MDYHNNNPFSLTEKEIVSIIIGALLIMLLIGLFG